MIFKVTLRTMHEASFIYGARMMQERIKQLPSTDNIGIDPQVSRKTQPRIKKPNTVFRYKMKGNKKEKKQGMNKKLDFSSSQENPHSSKGKASSITSNNPVPQQL